METRFYIVYKKDGTKEKREKVIEKQNSDRLKSHNRQKNKAHELIKVN